MRKTKRFLCLLTSLIMLLSLNVNTFANEKNDGYVVEINEYDEYNKSRAMTNTDLYKIGYSKEYVEEVKSNYIENELLKRSKLSVQELKEKYGYDENQINIIKNYDGQAIEEQPQLRVLFATMTVSIYKYIADNTQVAFIASWDWSSMPFVNGKDLIAVRWQGTNSNGQSINLVLNKSKSYCNIYYYNLADGQPYEGYAAMDIKSKDSYSHAYSDIEMGKNFTWFGKSGTIKIHLDKLGTAQILETAFIVTYGHETTGFSSPTVSFPAGFSITLKGNVEEMFYEVFRIDNKGNVIRY